MFTGLVQQAGRLGALERSGGGWRLEVTCQPWGAPLEIGESVAVQGACLTVAELGREGFAADLLDETVARTALGELPPGARLNLERALRVGDRLGGHFVSGHVDEKGVIEAVERQGRDFLLRVGCSAELARLTVPKGSIALDGVSLTIIEAGARHLSVAIIPHTWRETSLCERQRGDRVNLEADLLAKHVARLLGEGLPARRGAVDADTLLRAGFE